jgi:hypothetical protein
MEKALKIMNEMTSRKVELATAEQVSARIKMMEKVVNDAERVYSTAMAEANQFSYAIDAYNKAVNEADSVYRYLNNSDIILKDIQAIRSTVAKASAELGVNVPEPFDLDKAEQIAKEAISHTNKLKALVSKFKPVKI